jgi:cell division protease FtsH
VTQYAGGLVTIYGMSDKMGLVGYNSASEEAYTKPYSEQTNEDIDREMRAIVDQCY